MSAVCPACGVAVVPGYVRCPKCHAGLPVTGRLKRATGDPGGTAVVNKGFPIAPLVVAVGVAAAIIVVFEVRSRGAKKPAPVLVAPAEPFEAVRAAPAVRPVGQAALAAPATTQTGSTAAVDPRAALAELEAVLRTQRLWGRIDVAGPRLDVRSGSCGDPAMRPAIEGKKPVLHSAGLTRLRCVAQSGAVVFELDL
jgi:hypothetical protein